MSEEMKIRRYGPLGIFVRYADYEALQQQLAAAREATQVAEADASRYRQLRDPNRDPYLPCVKTWDNQFLKGEKLDATLQRDRQP